MTPVRNEAWILDKFLSYTCTWADRIVIADQLSGDQSVSIAARYSKVSVVMNPSASYNENTRQLLLINEARRFPGKKLLIALDTDEFFTPGFMDSPDWKKMLRAPPGSVFGFKWINVLPDATRGWFSEGYFPFAVMDDGKPHTGTLIHSPRIPIGHEHHMIPVKDFHLLHLQYINWKRMESKQRFYQCVERISYPHKTPVELYRTYHHMYNIPKKSIVRLNPEIRKFITGSVDSKDNGPFWFDHETEKLLKAHEPKTFRKEAIWDGSWSVKDPRSLKDKLIHRYWKASQRLVAYNLVKRIDRYLRFHY